jgi:hypothetical protein
VILAMAGGHGRVPEGAEATVFGAGAGPGSAPERKLTLDRDGAIDWALEAVLRAG